MFNADQSYNLSPQVLLRPEQFGALAYHYGNRRLTFLRSDALADLVRSLDGHATVAEALDVLDLSPQERKLYERSLESLADCGVICAD